DEADMRAMQRRGLRRYGKRDRIGGLESRGIGPDDPGRGVAAHHGAAFEACFRHVMGHSLGGAAHATAARLIESLPPSAEARNFLSRKRIQSCADVTTRLRGINA